MIIATDFSWGKFFLSKSIYIHFREFIEDQQKTTAEKSWHCKTIQCSGGSRWEYIFIGKFVTFMCKIDKNGK